MSAAVDNNVAHHPEDDAVEGLPPGFGEGLAGRIAFWIAVTFSLFQLWTAAYGTLASQVVRAMHVGFLLLLGFVLIANLMAKSGPVKAWFWTLGIVGFLTGIYNWVFYFDIIQRAGFLTHTDLVVGTVAIVLVFEAARRLMGLPLAIIAGLFLAYCFFGQYLPAPFIHRGYSYEQIVEHFGFGTEGIYGTPIYVSADLHLPLRPLRGLPGAGRHDCKLFNDFALGLVGGSRGGPAQVCGAVVGADGHDLGLGRRQCRGHPASSPFPLMKRFGYRSDFAGGVEATASMGGQIMPPVMGAVAFIMAETLNVPYASIVQAAIIPALFLYFGVCLLDGASGGGPGMGCGA
jgi:TRAP transporter 4TM/12TM fusion protein